MRLGRVLYEVGSTLMDVCFPTTVIVFLLYVMEGGASPESSVLGNEGIVGIALLMCGGVMSSLAVVLSDGQGFRLKAQMMKAEFKRSGSVLHLLLRRTQALITLITQMAQPVVCNGHHSLEQKLCRWLLVSLDRLPTYDLDDPRTDRRHARLSLRTRGGGGPRVAGGRAYPLCAGPHFGAELQRT